MKTLEGHARQAGLRINKQKSKYMILGRQAEKAEDQNLKIGGPNEEITEIERVRTITYLGVQITEDGREEEELKVRLTKGDKAAGALSSIINSKLVSRKAKIQLYKTVLRPTVTYGCEIWKLGTVRESKLLVWERKILRRIYGGRKVEGEWKRRTNKELQELYKGPTIVQYIKQQRIRWLGHIQRLDNNRMTKKVLQTSSIGTKAKGRPRSRWKNEVLQDLKHVGVEDWRRAAADRKKWRKIISAMGLQGL